MGAFELLEDDLDEPLEMTATFVEGKMRIERNVFESTMILLVADAVLDAVLCIFCEENGMRLGNYVYTEGEKEEMGKKSENKERVHIEGSRGEST